MLFTASANRFIRAIAIPISILTYGLYLLYDHLQWYDSTILPVVEAHKKNLRRISALDGIVFGGSNCVYSISAELIGKKLGEKWYNACVQGEGAGENYEEIILDLTRTIDRSEVDTVIYSTQIPYVKGGIERASIKSSRDKATVTIKPRRSIASRIYEFLTSDGIVEGRKSLPLPNKFGDQDFKNGECKFDEIEKAHREPVDKVVEFLLARFSFFASQFRNASVIIAPASEYYGEKFDSSAFESAVSVKLAAMINQNTALSHRKISLVFQPPFPDESFVCDDRSHANDRGRVWRTLDLMDRIVDTSAAHANH
jgi:hypothetical protein